MALVASVLALVGGLVVARRAAREPRAPAPAPAQAGDVDARAGGDAPGARVREANPPDATSPTASPSSTGSRLLAWGLGPGRVGRPGEREGHGESALRVAADARGTTFVLDAANGRVVQLLADGGVGADVRLPPGDALDVAAVGDGRLALLARGERGDGRIVLTSPDGRAGPAIELPGDVAAKARSVVVAGRDVYVESRSGEHRKVGDVSGRAEPAPALAPGAPTRDGEAFVTAILPSPDAGVVHVFVVDGKTRLQRWSRLVRPRVAVEGIVLAETDAAGVVYLVVTGAPPGGAEDARAAVLLCFDAARGDALGSVDLPVVLGAEAITDAHALDEGGVTLAIAARAGLRVERHACP